jgi:hypothetical protein
MMPKDYALTGRNVVVAILHFYRRNSSFRVQFKDLPSQKFPVGVIGNKVKDESAQSDGKSLHGRRGSGGEEYG